MERCATQIAAKLLKSWLPVAPPLGTITFKPGEHASIRVIVEQFVHPFGRQSGTFH